MRRREVRGSDSLPPSRLCIQVQTFFHLGQACELVKGLQCKTVSDGSFHKSERQVCVFVEFEFLWKQSPASGRRREIETISKRC